MPAPILGHTRTIQAGTRETTKTVVNGTSYLHCHLNQEKSHERDCAPDAIMLHSRWSSCTRGVDKPPSQPLRCRPMSGGQPNSVASVKESHQEDPGTRQVRRLQQRDSMWTSGGAGTTKARPPLRRGQAFRRLQHGACRWTSNCRATLDKVPTPAPAPHRMISSNVSALKPSVEMKDRDIVEITLMALCIFNMSGKPLASIKSPVSPPMKPRAPFVSQNALTQMRFLLPRLTPPHASIISKSA